MGHLSHKDVAALMNTVGELYTNPASPDFPVRAVRAVAKLISAEVTHFASMDFKNGTRAFVPSAGEIYPETFMNDFPRFVHQHPAFHQQMMKCAPAPRAVKIRFSKKALRHLAEGRAMNLSHMQTPREYLRSELYNEWFRPNGIQHQLGINFIHTESRVDSIALTRCHGNFSDRERQMLDLLGPHFRHTFGLHQQFIGQKQEMRQLGKDSLPATMEEFGLTDREAEVLHWVAQGKNNEDIATILGGISPLTVKKHLCRIFEKLGVENRTAAALMTMEFKNGPSPRA